MDRGVLFSLRDVIVCDSCRREIDFPSFVSVDRLELLSKHGWNQVMQLLAQRSKSAYNAAASEVFTRCVQQHMNDDDRSTMMAADVYVCPECETLLKDRKSPVASGILLERKRLAQLWLDVETASIRDFDAAFDRFRRALGLGK